jgi:large subunit ribosomal protein L25
MERLKLEVSLREGTGKGAARKLRSAGQVPAVFYGRGQEAVHVQIPAVLLERAVHGGANALIDLQGPKQVAKKPVLIKDLQRDPSTRKLLHCDLFAVDLSEKLTVDVPIHYVGRAKGVVEQDGVLEPLHRTIEVSCMPLAIPESVEIDVSALAIGDTIHLRDVVLPDDAEALGDADLSLIHVVAPRVEEEEPKEEEEEVVAEGAEAAEAAPEAEAPAKDGGES